MLDENKSAWHAGISKWKGLEKYQIGVGYSVNLVSVGIELENNGAEEYVDSQYDSLIYLIKDIRTRWDIPLENIVGHVDVAPQRKIDPYTYFDWLRVKRAIEQIEFPDWALDSIDWSKRNKIIEKPTGQYIEDYRLAVIMNKFTDFLDKRFKK
jgi:N-acetylmuramoyl-L-alanine amidase